MHVTYKLCLQCVKYKRNVDNKQDILKKKHSKPIRKSLFTYDEFTMFFLFKLLSKMPDNINTLVGRDDFACFCIHTANKYYLGEKKRKEIW